MRFYLDEDISQRVAEVARASGVDVVSSHECGRNGLSDEEQLRLAAADGRCVVTRNYADFSRHTHTFWQLSLPHAGVLLVATSLPNEQFAAIAEALAGYDREHPLGLVPYQIDYLARQRNR